MSYCSEGQKPRIIYTFDKEERTYQSDKSPIEVTTYTKRVNATENYREEGFELSYYSPNNRAQITGVVRDYIVYYSPDYDYGPNYEGISSWNCFDLDFPRDQEGNPVGPGCDITTIRVNPNRKCPTPLKNMCYIEIKYQGSVIFQDQGNCPIGFSVQCGECPEGSCKCDTPGYPGYCCLPCNTIKGGIIQVAQNIF